jgi:4-amino-4-deoxy-L-arabinose transferase-like glycosyltransferase
MRDRKMDLMTRRTWPMPVAGWLLLVVILAGAFWLRGHDPLYNTAFEDEHTYVMFGNMFLNHHFEAPYEQPLTYSMGWYLWSIMAALAHRAGGLAAVRLLSAALGTLTVLAVFGFTKRVFGWQAGLSAAAIFAVASPPIWAFRIATYDAGAIFFLAVGLWLYGKAWDEERDLVWLAAAAAMFAAFLSKYMVAIFFPALVLLTLWKNWRAMLYFSGALTLACAAYAAYYRADLWALIVFYRTADTATAPISWVDTYVLQRLDLWLLVAVGLLAVRVRPAIGRPTVPLLWLGVVILLGFQMTSGFLGPRFYKQATYALLFLVPLAAAGLLDGLRFVGRRAYPTVAVLAVVLLSAGVAAADRSWDTPRHIFWPNVDPVLAFFEGRVAPTTTFLVDDVTLRAYLMEEQAALPPRNVQDVNYLRYGQLEGPAAFAAAVRDGVYDYVVLDSSGMQPPVLAMHKAIQPGLERGYDLLVHLPEPGMRRVIEIYQRKDPPVVRPSASPGRPRIEIRAPLAGVPVLTHGIETKLTGQVFGAPAGSYLTVDLFTDRWYLQADRVAPDQAGTFTQTVYLGGQGVQQCGHVLRVRLFAPGGGHLATATELGVIRANADGTAPSCR